MTDRLRLAIDVLPLGGERTGVGRFCGGLVAALHQRGDLGLVPYVLSRHARRDAAAAVRVLGVPVKRRAVPTRLLNGLWARSDLLPVELLVGPVEVVHGTNYVVPPARRAGRVVSVYDLTALRYPELCAPASLAYPRLVARAAGAGAFVHVTSAFVRDEVVELLGVPPGRVRVVPPGLDPPAQQPATAGRKAPYVLALGAVEPRKDLPTLVAAFAELAGLHPELELVVAGPTGWAEAAFEAAVGSSGVAGRIVRLGYLPEAQRRALLGGAAVLAYPSLYEGFGFPPLEAMAAGVPVVATNSGSIPEVVGDAAELVAPGDAPALAGALARVLGDGALRARLVAAGRARAAVFDWAASAASMLELYLAAYHDRQQR